MDALRIFLELVFRDAGVAHAQIGAADSSDEVVMIAAHDMLHRVFLAPQTMLHSLMRTLTLYLSRKYAETYLQSSKNATLANQMRLYIETHSDSVTLGDLAEHFGYHPNYISSYLHKNTGKTFSELLLEKRMEKARLLLENTGLTIEVIADMLGYSNASNFYKAFHSYFHTSPRNYQSR